MVAPADELHKVDELREDCDALPTDDLRALHRRDGPGRPRNEEGLVRLGVDERKCAGRTSPSLCFLNRTAKLFPTEQVRAVLRDAGIPAEHWTRRHIFLKMLSTMKRRMVEDGTVSKAQKPDSVDARLQRDVAATQTALYPGFEAFDLAPRVEQLAADVRPSLEINQQMKSGLLDVGLRGYAVKPWHTQCCNGLAG